MLDGKHALVVVACIAGFGAAAGVFVQEAGDAPTYASELFGTGSDALVVQYPTCKDAATGSGSPKATCDDGDASTAAADDLVSDTLRSKPWVKLHFTNDNTVDIDGTLTDIAFADADAVIDTAEGSEGTANAKGEVTFTLSTGEFGETVASDNLTGLGAISVLDGGNKGDSEVTFAVDLGTEGADDDDALTFVLPRLQGLSALGSDKLNAVHVSVTTRGTGGAGFPTGGVGYFFCPERMTSDGTTTAMDTCEEDDDKTLGRAVTVAKDAPAVTFASTAHPTANIDIDNRSMLADKATQAAVATLSLTVTQGTATTPILQADGSIVDNDVRGVLDVDASGTMQLFGGDDKLYVDYNGNKKEDLGEALTVEGDAASFNGGGLSIDPDDKGNAARAMVVYYVPGGKDDLAHGSIVHIMAAINFTPATAADKMAKATATELRFKGVAGELKAYAIPFDGNGKGDKANVRVRCEDGVMNKDGDSMCRVFLECWSDMGMRSFGESDAVYEGAGRRLERR